MVWIKKSYSNNYYFVVEGRIDIENIEKTCLKVNFYNGRPLTFDKQLVLFKT